ncbi:MAG: mutY [Oscillospiraceae bacterium]|jgi:A/G-specific adenine glycosylase|nr:mutY [Oscillospiraceae bacterium]
MEHFAEMLLGWYDCNARVLPWRDEPTPYRVWISEIMLQQTRVDTVKPYFERFIGDLPTVQALAEVSEDKLLKLWEGLGYYSRALNLKKAANVIVKDFGGQIPSDIEQLKTLPGIGPYSSGAISSIAFGKKATAVDGNVLRVIARITADRGDITDVNVKKQIGQLVYDLLPAERMGDFNQALMELGATVCVPNGAPKCGECPVQSLCKGFEQGIAEQLPTKKAKTARKVETKTVLIIEHNGSYAIRQRLNERLLSNLWEYPIFDGHLTADECKDELEKLGIVCNKMFTLKKAKHIFTHMEWHMIGYLIISKQAERSEEFVWVTKEQIQKQYSLPTALKKYTEVLMQFSEEQLFSSLTCDKT